MTGLTLTLPDTVDVEDLEREIVTAVADRLRDDHGYELMADVRSSASGTAKEYLPQPTSSILVAKKSGALRVKLKGVNVDAHDLFTGVSSQLEQRHEGLRTEIG